MTRVIVHAGFHKTGTTSLQGFLERNREALKPYAAVYLKTDLGSTRYLGRWYGQRPSPFRRLVFRRGLRRFLRGIPDAPVILISRESLSGIMPGNRRWGRVVTRYDPVAGVLAREIAAALQQRFGPGTEVEFLYTIRGGAAFVESLWGHVLRTRKLTDDLVQFQARFDPLPDLRSEAVRIGRAVDPALVYVAALEETARSRLGPGQIVLDILRVPVERYGDFVPGPHGNPGPSPDLRQRFLAMNRSGGMRRAALKAEKLRLWEAERRANKQPGLDRHEIDDD